MALWTQAVTDQYKAEELAEKTLKAKSCTRNQALTVGVFASAIHTQSIRHRLATIAVAKYPQDQEILALFLPFLTTEHRYEDLKSYEEKGTHGSVLRYFDDESAARDLLTFLFEHFDRLKSAKTKEKRANGMVARANNGGNVIIKDILYQAKNGSMLVSLKTTNHKAHSTYKINGVEVDKATYETMVKPSAYNDSGVFTIKLENLISLG